MTIPIIEIISSNEIKAYADKLNTAIKKYNKINNSFWSTVKSFFNYNEPSVRAAQIDALATIYKIQIELEKKHNPLLDQTDALKKTSDTLLEHLTQECKVLKTTLDELEIKISSPFTDLKNILSNMITSQDFGINDETSSSKAEKIPGYINMDIDRLTLAIEYFETQEGSEGKKEALKAMYKIRDEMDKKYPSSLFETKSAFIDLISRGLLEILDHESKLLSINSYEINTHFKPSNSNDKWIDAIATGLSQMNMNEFKEVIGLLNPQTDQYNDPNNLDQQKGLFILQKEVIGLLNPQTDQYNDPNNLDQQKGLFILQEGEKYQLKILTKNEIEAEKEKNNTLTFTNVNTKITSSKNTTHYEMSINTEPLCMFSKKDPMGPLQAQFAFREHPSCDFLAPYYASRLQRDMDLYYEYIDTHYVLTDYYKDADLLTYAKKSSNEKKINPCDIFSNMAECYIKAEQAGFLISDGKLTNWGLKDNKVVLLDTKGILFSSKEHNKYVYNPKNTEGLYHIPISSFHITPDDWGMDCDATLSIDVIHTYALGISLLEYITGKSIIENLGGPDQFKFHKIKANFDSNYSLISTESMHRILNIENTHEKQFYMDLIQGLITRDPEQHLSMDMALSRLKTDPKIYGVTQNKKGADEKPSEQKQSPINDKPAYQLPRPRSVTSDYNKASNSKTTQDYRKIIQHLTDPDTNQKDTNTQSTRKSPGCP